MNDNKPELKHPWQMYGIAFFAMLIGGAFYINYKVRGGFHTRDAEYQGQEALVCSLGILVIGIVFFMGAIKTSWCIKKEKKDKR